MAGNSNHFLTESDQKDVFGTFLTKLTAIIASLFIICSIVLVAINRDEIRKTQSVLELEENKDSDLPQIPESNK